MLFTGERGCTYVRMFGQHGYGGQHQRMVVLRRSLPAYIVREKQQYHGPSHTHEGGGADNELL